MATGWFFKSSYQACRSLKYLLTRSLNQSSAHHSLLQPLTQQSGLHKLGTMGASESCGSAYMLPIIVSSLLGFGVIDTAYADSNQATDKPQLPSEQPPSCFADLEEAAKKERRRLEDLLRSRGLLYGTYPRFTVSIKGQKITIKFQVPPACEVPRLIANLVSTLGMKVEDRAGGPELLLRASDSAVAWQITLSRREYEKVEEMVHDADAIPEEPELVVSIFRSLLSADKAEVEFIKRGSFTEGELDALASLLQIAGERPRRKQESKQVEQHGEPSSMNKSIASLESMGVRVFGLDEPCVGQRSNQISWDTIAGYEQQKREIEDTILLALQSPEIYDDIARGTRRKFESNRPRAVLFEGPPGTGKTSCARVIANQAGVPLLYVPLEVVMSKYYGESERLLGKVFTLADELPNGAIIFLDEVDSFAVARDSEIHEATRRILSVLLRQIDGFEQEKKVVVIAATNRKQDLDPALISRFDSMITFGLPDLQNREEIAAQFAKHLTKNDLSEFASATVGMSGRDIRDVCLQAERRWASKIIRGQTTGVVKEDSLPPLSEYIECAAERSKILHAVEKQRYQDFNMRRDRRPLDMS